MFGGRVGIWELAIILIITIVVFGGNKIIIFLRDFTSILKGEKKDNNKKGKS